MTRPRTNSSLCADTFPQLCPDLPTPSPPPPSPSPPPPKVYTSKGVVVKSQKAQNVLKKGPSGPHKLNGGATSTSTETLVDQVKNVVDTTSTTAANQVGRGNGHVIKSTPSTDTTATLHPVTRTVHNSPPPPPPSPSPPPPKVYTSKGVVVKSQQEQNVLKAGPSAHKLNGGATTTSTETLVDQVEKTVDTTSTTAQSQIGSGNGHVIKSGRSTDTTSTTHPVTRTVYNSPPPPPPSPSPPPPTVYNSAHVGAGSQQQVVDGAVTTHVLNNGATTTSTEAVQHTVQHKYVDTTTTAVSQIGSGNGNVVSQSTTTDSTSTSNPIINAIVNTFPSTTDMRTSTETSPGPTSSSEGSIGGCSGALQVMDVNKNLCLHVKGTATGGGFTVADLKRPVITMPCVAGSPNQMFTATSTNGGDAITHVATGMQLSTVQDVTNGAVVTLAAPGNQAQELWLWATPSTGGPLVSAANPQFEITDNQVHVGASVGLPVHLWHLFKSLPTGSPKAQWAAQCAATASA